MKTDPAPHGAGAAGGMEEACRRFFELAPDLMCAIGFDGSLRHVNPAWGKAVGLAPGEAASRPFCEFLHPDDRAAFEAGLRALAAGAPTLSLEARIRLGDGQYRDISWSATASPEDRTCMAVGRDVASRKQAEERFRLAVEAAPNAMMIVAAGGAIVLMNAGAEKLFGYSRAELLGRSIDLLVPGRFRPRHSRECAEFFARPQVRAMGSGRDLLGIRKDGREVPIEIGLNPMVTPEGTFVLVSLIDITPRKREEIKLRQEAIRDPLTGLYNRRYLDETLDRELHRSSRKKAPLSVIFLDVDHFKDFNDTHGHAAGDAVLREVARLLMGWSRHGDIACRYGGEELILILPETGADDARRKAEELRLKVGQVRLSLEGKALGPVTISAGVASFPAHGATAEAILKAADAALYRAKRGGRNRVVPAE